MENEHESSAEGIQKTSQASPLYDPYRMELFEHFTKAAGYAAFLRSYFAAHGKVQRLHEEEYLNESVRYLWVLVRTKVISMTDAKRSYFKPLLALDDFKHTPTTEQLLADLNLIRDYLEDFGLFKVENAGLSFGEGYKFARGFKDKKRLY